MFSSNSNHTPALTPACPCPQVSGAEYGLRLSEAVLRLGGAEPPVRRRLDLPDEDAARAVSDPTGDAEAGDSRRRAGTGAGSGDGMDGAR